MNRYANTAPLPERLSRLHELAIDLWWSWNADARSVFRRLDYGLWRETDHNPIKMLSAIPLTRLDQTSVSLVNRADMPNISASRMARPRPSGPGPAPA